MMIMMCIMIYCYQMLWWRKFLLKDVCKSIILSRVVTLATFVSLFLAFFTSHFSQFGLASKAYRNRCPSSEQLYPCYCNSAPQLEERLNCVGAELNTYRCQMPVISCINTGLLSLRKIFVNLPAHIHNINYLKFEWLYLADPAIHELTGALLEGVYFSNIYIVNCPNLTVINEAAFGNSNSLFTRNLYINATSLSDEPHKRRSTFRAISSLRNAEVIEIQSSNFTAIPYKAFNSRNSNTRVIRFYNPDRRQHLRVVATKAFYRAGKVEEIDLKNNYISRIKPYAFYFQQTAHHELRIFLSANSLHSGSFERNSLLGGNGRNVTLYLGDYGYCNLALTTLRQEVFEPFFAENPGNVVDMYSCPLLCDHRMEWLLSQLDRYRNQVRNLECLDREKYYNKGNYYQVAK